MDRRQFLNAGIGMMLAMQGMPATAKEKLKRNEARAFIVTNDYVDAANYELFLQNTLPDGELIASVAEMLQFRSVSVSVNAREAEFKKQLWDFVAAVKPDEVAFIYIAGHGMQLHGENFLLLGDGLVHFNVTSMVDALRFRTSWLVVMLDMCRTGVSEEESTTLALARSVPMTRSIAMAPGTRSASNAFKVKTDYSSQVMDELADVGTFDVAGTGVKVIFATDPRNVAYDYVQPDDGNSPFAVAVARNLVQKKSLDDIVSQITGDVLASTEGKQSPWTQGSMGEPIFLAGPPPAKNPSRVPFNVPG